MALPIETLEAFFEAKFDTDGQPARVLRHFDGYAYWHVLYIQEYRLLKITAGDEPGFTSFPTVEIEGVYSDEIRVGPLSGGVGTVLILQPKDLNSSSVHVAFTKLRSGRISLSLGLGQVANA
jgi:hypothetical protein